jgi:ribosome-associated protein YbcJ (S4-like RNA binding protein)
MDRRTTTVAVALVLVAACTGGGSGDPNPPAATRAMRGAITAKTAGTMTVNGVALTTSGAVVRIDGASGGDDALREGMVVTVHGSFDDRGGDAAEIEFEHELEGQVDDRGTDFVSVGGQRVHVDDATEFGEDNPDRLGSIAVGDVIAVSGVPDDRGGLRASRVDDSPRAADGVAANDDDLDVKGFVSGYVAGAGFELRISPDATSWWDVTVGGVAVPAGLGDGAYVEVHALQPPAAPGEGAPAGLLGTIAASAIEVEDRFGEAEVEVEGIVTSGGSASFVVDGVEVVTDGATAWRLGAPADLVAGVKVEAEGQLDASGVLHAGKVSFRPGVRISARLQDLVWDAGSGTGTATILGVPVQLPSFARYDVVPANDLRVEVRGNPNAAGDGIVASRVSAYSSGGGDRVEVRALVAAKASPAEGPTFDVLGLTIVTNAAADAIPDTGFRDASDAPMTAPAFYAAVEAGHTVVNARAASAADLTGSRLLAEQVELEGSDE